MTILWAASLGSNFTASFRKTSALESSLLLALGVKVHEYLSEMVSGNDCKYCNLIES